MKPTVVLVHGAFADSSSWNGVAERLSGEGLSVVAFAAPLRGVATDAALLDDLLRSTKGPVVLAGHSYGGAVITNTGAGDVLGLVYVAGSPWYRGELRRRVRARPGSTLGETLELVPLAAGGADAYIPRSATTSSSRRTCRRPRRR
jgi:pimeloyl-ACP methyl ester carboxylesterase